MFPNGEEENQEREKRKMGKEEREERKTRRVGMRWEKEGKEKKKTMDLAWFYGLAGMKTWPPKFLECGTRSRYKVV